jgi:hypothetical protein
MAIPAAEDRITIILRTTINNRSPIIRVVTIMPLRYNVRNLINVIPATPVAAIKRR